MAITQNDIEELKAEIEADKKALAEKEAALKFFESRQGKSKTKASASSTASEGIIALDELIPDITKTSLVDDVKNVVKRFGGQEFSVAHVDIALQQQGIKIKGKLPRSRISVALGKLEDQGIIRRTFKGGGNVPNKYVLTENDLV
jgi:hypothetical protein